MEMLTKETQIEKCHLEPDLVKSINMGNDVYKKELVVDEK